MKATIFLAALMFAAIGVAQAGSVVINDKGTTNADITVDATAGGVAVMDAKTARRGAIIRNSAATSGTAAMRCGPASLTVTATAGTLLNPGEALTLGSEGQEAWKCIRTTGSSATANVTEAY